MSVRSESENALSEAELRLWFERHRGKAGEKENVITIPASEDRQGRQTPAQRIVESVTYEAADGATITVKQRQAPPAGTMGPSLAETDATYVKTGETPPDPARAGQSPAQQRATEAAATKNEFDNIDEVRKNNERSWNQTSPLGSGLPETHLERAARETQKAEADRRDAAERRQQAAEARASQALENTAAEQAADRRSREQEGAANRQLTQQQINETVRRNQFEENKPNYLSQADPKSKYVVTGNAKGEISSVLNPNYDEVKAAAEEKRAELASQIAGRQMNLEEAKAAYTQWFDTNVKTPMMMAQEARAKAEEQRAALDAEERRRQFAADFGLRKATLGESAAQRATNAEISLLPYRAGPTESSEMSSAINSLAAGGKINGPDASAGIHFTPGAFEFNAPDFASIAKKAAKAVLSGLTDYRPSDQQYQTADYSGVPQVNLSGAPQMPQAGVGGVYNYSPQPLPPPSQDY